MLPQSFPITALPQMVIAGCACGMGAVFNSPLGATLFAMEEFMDSSIHDKMMFHRQSFNLAPGTRLYSSGEIEGVDYLLAEHELVPAPPPHTTPCFYAPRARPRCPLGQLTLILRCAAFRRRTKPRRPASTRRCLRTDLLARRT